MTEPDDRSPQDVPDDPKPWDRVQDGPQDEPQPWDVPLQDWSDTEETQQSRRNGQGAAWVVVALIVVCCVLLVAAVGSVISSHQDQLSTAVSAVTGRGSSLGSSKSRNPPKSKSLSKSQDSSKSQSPSKPKEQKSKKKATGFRSDGSDGSGGRGTGSDSSDAGSGTDPDSGGDTGSGSLAAGTDALPDGFEDTAGTEGISVANWRKIRIGATSGSTRQQVERLLGKPEDVSTSTAAGKKRVFLVWRTYRDGRRIRGATVDLRDGHALYKQIINFRTENDGTVTRGQHDRIAKGQSRQQVAVIAGRPDYLSRMNSSGTPTETWTYGNNAKGGVRFTVTFLRGSVISVSSAIEKK